MSKAVLFLADGMGDEPLDELGGKTPVEAVETPNMDRIARDGASGTFLTLPEGFATSSDVANMSVLGYDLATCYCGRGPLEALSQGIELGPKDFAYRCNLVCVDDDDVLIDYSGGHIEQKDSVRIMQDLAAEYNCDEFSFHPGISYRNLLILHGDQFTDKIEYAKPDASQDMAIEGILPKPVPGDEKSMHTAEFLIALMHRTRSFLAEHPINKERAKPANMIWPWSPGPKPAMQAFDTKYGAKGAIISAVDVVFGLGAAAEMDLIRVEGATGFVDTNYEGKADAAVKALETHDFVYVHVEAIDECGHMGDLDLKMKAIKDFDQRLMARVMEQLDGQDVTYAILPDHPVPVKKRVHTRTPVAVSICGKHIQADDLQRYGESLAPGGGLGSMKGDELMKLVLGGR